jgi:hypothetical protein
LLEIVSVDSLVMYALTNLILSLFSILCFINIFWYFFIRYVLDNNKIILEKMEKWLWLKKIIILYKYTNIYFVWVYIIYFFNGDDSSNKFKNNLLYDLNKNNRF